MMTDDEMKALAAKLAVQSGFVPEEQAKLMNQAADVIVELLVLKIARELIAAKRKPS